MLPPKVNKRPCVLHTHRREEFLICYSLIVVRNGYIRHIKYAMATLIYALTEICILRAIEYFFI